MNYRTDKYGNEISVLGFGCMRFTQIRGKTKVSEIALSFRMSLVTLI